MSTISVQIRGFREITDQLNIFRRAQLPFLLQQSLNRGLAPELRSNEQNYLRSVFPSAVPFTINSPMTSEWASFQSLAINFKHRDMASGGNEPAKYLRPQAEGGPVYITRFNRRLQARNTIRENQYATYWTARPRLANTTLARILNVLEAGGDENYFVINPDRRTSSPRTLGGGGPVRRGLLAGYRGPGVYSIASGRLQQVFAIVNRVPAVRRKYDWSEQRITATAEAAFNRSVVNQMQEIWGN